MTPIPVIEKQTYAFKIPAQFLNLAVSVVSVRWYNIFRTVTKKIIL